MKSASKTWKDKAAARASMDLGTAATGTTGAANGNIPTRPAANALSADTLSEITAGAGIAVDGVTCKDGSADVSGSGCGIKLSSTPGNADANTLDCYVESALNTGWTPVLGAASENPTVSAYNTQKGTYTRNGRACDIDVNIVTTTGTVSGGSGGIRVNLPFTPAIESVLCCNTNKIGYPSGYLNLQMYVRTDGYAYLRACGDNLDDVGVDISKWNTSATTGLNFSGRITI
jgi:hypothetical protein